MKLKFPSTNAALDDEGVGFALLAVPEENEMISPKDQEGRKYWKRRSAWKYTVEVCRRDHVCTLLSERMYRYMRRLFQPIPTYSMHAAQAGVGPMQLPLGNFATSQKSLTRYVLCLNWMRLPT